MSIPAVSAEPTEPVRRAVMVQRWADLVYLHWRYDPAVVQSLQLHGVSKQPFLASTFMAPPLVAGQYVSRRYADRLAASDPDIDAEEFFDRPPLKQFRGEQVSHWQRRLGRWFDIGTLYTMLAGMLNVLVIYDAWAGPLGTPTDADRKTRTNPKTKT